MIQIVYVQHHATQTRFLSSSTFTTEDQVVVSNPTTNTTLQVRRYRMETGTRQIVASLKAQTKSIRDLPKVVVALWQFSLTEDQRELAKQSLKAYIMSQVIGKTKSRNDREEVDRILNTKPL